ncbi:hypothetical protein SUGI_0129490 [Cryptomeria japonica]|nr:hypothetical protein SUGI_0129490 [Cryptomeria japonica]
MGLVFRWLGCLLLIGHDTLQIVVLGALLLAQMLSHRLHPLDGKTLLELHHIISGNLTWRINKREIYGDKMEEFSQRSCYRSG